MDPNACLARIRELLDPARGSRMLLGDDDYATELASAVADLDEWLSRGGFLPAAWASAWASPGRS